MQVKRHREDFIVREISRFATSAPGASAGRHAVYQLEKCGLGTPEAASQILSVWNLPRKHLSYGGLKDRHAWTWQTITILDGPASDLEQPGFKLTYLGQARRGFTPQDIQANEFELTLRGLSAARGKQMAGQLQASQWAIPNYFDEQRFGSVGISGRFVAQPWCLGDYEQALYLAIAEANRHDRPDDRGQKEILRQHWGDWQTCKDRLERSHRRSLVTYLVDHPSGFKKAVGLIRKDLRSLYVAAFQAKIWNEIVARQLRQRLPADHLLPLDSVAGQWAFPRQLDAELLQAWRDWQIPLPSGRHTQWSPEVRSCLDEVLAELGLQLHQLRFSYPRDVFFARGQRDVFLTPEVRWVRLEPDDGPEPQAGCRLHVCVRLKAGQYATMLLKGLELLAGE